MASYVVMEPSRGGEERAVLVRDGFHFLAFLLPAVWLLFHRLWLEAVLAIAAAMLLGSLAALAGFGPASSFLSLLVSLYVGLEGAALKVAALRRRGWREWGVVEAENARDAEIRYLDGFLDDGDAAGLPPAALAARPVSPGRPSPAPALGMLGYPGRT